MNRSKYFGTNSGGPVSSNSSTLSSISSVQSGVPPPYVGKRFSPNSNSDSQTISAASTTGTIGSHASTIIPSTATISASTMPAAVASRARDTVSMKTNVTGAPLDKYLGYADLPNQVYRRAVKKGFDFNLMLLGESGAGKATFINSFFTTDIYDNENFPGPSKRFNNERLEIHTSKMVMSESGVSLRLTVVDVPGYGDLVDNSDCWKPVSSYVDRQYFEYLAAEMELDRDINHRDNRIHCLLYFIQPGHGLKPVDIMTMKRLHEKVNIVPLISKADTMTPEETTMLKQKIMTQIADNDIQVYDFPERTFDEPNSNVIELRKKLPFAVVGSNQFVVVSNNSSNNKQVRGRKYPWGVVLVDEPLHCDTAALRTLLLGSHMDDLIEVTNNVHYENYRRTVLMKWIGITDGELEQNAALSLFGLVVERKTRHENKMKRMKDEMERVFETKVQEKLQKLENNEHEMRLQSDRMRNELSREENEIAKLEERLEHEKRELCEAYPHLIDAVRRGATYPGNGSLSTGSLSQHANLSALTNNGMFSSMHSNNTTNNGSVGGAGDAGGGGASKKEKKKLGGLF